MQLTACPFHFSGNGSDRPDKDKLALVSYGKKREANPQPKRAWGHVAAIYETRIVTMYYEPSCTCNHKHSE